LRRLTEKVLQPANAKSESWQGLVKLLPAVRPSCYVLDQDRVCIGQAQDLSADQHRCLRKVLDALKPWRKGPFELFGVTIESEWNSALKWSRVAPHCKPLTGRRVLDVGCSNGYYLFRMAAAEPRVMLGIEPYLTYYHQFGLLQHYLQIPRLYGLPLTLESMTSVTQWFDTVFCMGVLYHRRSPLDALSQLRSLLAPGGELVLETLIIESDAHTALFPRARYAGMRNVYFIPTVSCLENWLSRSGFENPRCVSRVRTTPAEQRRTPWIDSESLEAFLDGQDPARTVEGYAAPVRAVVVADARA